MKTLMDETENIFQIKCNTCNRNNCHFEFTDSGQIVILCKACGETKIVFKED